MRLKKTLMALGAAAVLAGGSGMASAAINVENWVIDLGAIGDLGAGADNWTGYGQFGQNATLGLDSMSFSALFHSVTAGGIAIGSLQTTDTKGVVTQALNESGLVNETTTLKAINTTAGFELSFASTTTQMLTSIAPDAGGFDVGNRHLAAGTGPDSFVQNGYLYVYADIYGANPANGDGSTNCNTSPTTGGLGCQDGLVIGIFKIIESLTETGSFSTSPTSLDGSDNATFEMTFNYNGIIKDSDGNSLLIGETLAFTNSNTDADDDNNQVLDTNPANLTASGSLGPCGGTATNTCGIEDGSFNLQQQVPEPTSLALIGIALAGLGLSRRRAAKR